jgi:hypothetical protein
MALVNKKNIFTKKKNNFKLMEQYLKNNNYTLKKGGGPLSIVSNFIDYVDHTFKKWGFKKFIKEFNNSKKSLMKEYESFNADVETYKDAAEDKVKSLNRWLVASKVNIIIKNILKDDNEIKNDPILKRRLEYQLNVTKNVKEKSEKEIKRMIKDQKENKPEFVRRNKIFMENIKKFENVLDKYNKQTDFKQKVKTMKKKYQSLSKRNKEGLSKKHKKFIKKYEKRLADYEKIDSFTDSYIENTNKFVNNYTKLRRDVEFYEKQFLSDKVSAVSKMKSLENWEKQIEYFYNNLTDAIDEGGKYVKQFKEVKVKMKNIGARLQALDDKNKLGVIKDVIDLLNFCIKHQEDINDLMMKLKINFSNNQPAIRLTYDAKLIVSKVIFIKKKIDDINKLIQKL